MFPPDEEILSQLPEVERVIHLPKNVTPRFRCGGTAHFLSAKGKAETIKRCEEVVSPLLSLESKTLEIDEVRNLIRPVSCKGKVWLVISCDGTEIGVVSAPKIKPYWLEVVVRA